MKRRGAAHHLTKVAAAVDSVKAYAPIIPFVVPAQVGYRLLPGFVVSARGSFQGRTIQHAGPGFGGGASYTW